MVNADFYAQARQYRNFETETGLPNERYLNKRIDDEIARASEHEGALAIAVCLLENLDEIRSASGRGRAREVVQRTVEALRNHLRDFDVMGRTGKGEFTILMPDPGYSAGERVYALARAVADDVSNNSAINDPIRIALSFGYALYPTEGHRAEKICSREQAPLASAWSSGESDPTRSPTMRNASIKMAAISGRMMRGSGVSPERSCSRTLVPLTVTGFSSGCLSVRSTRPSDS